MKTKIVYICSLLMSFFSGVFITFLLMTKQQIDKTFKYQPVTVTTDDITNEKRVFEDNIPKIEREPEQQTLNQVNQLMNRSQDVTLNDFSQEQAIQIVDDMPNVVLEQYIDKFMARGASQLITDKRQFAKRAIEELYTPNDNQPLTGVVKLSLSKQVPEQSMDTNSIESNEKIYAHLDIEQQQLTDKGVIFVKWVNTTTGQVLLFEKKNIRLDSNQNWVSFKPDKAWEKGDYNIKFYEFTSELKPIAKIDYQVNQIQERKKIISKETSVVVKGSS